jgi:hypothetical protein
LTEVALENWEQGRAKPNAAVRDTMPELIELLPAQMIQPLVVTALSNTRYFSEVLASPHFGRHTFVLRSEILELKQDFTSEPGTGERPLRSDLRARKDAAGDATAGWITRAIVMNRSGLSGYSRYVMPGPTTLP